MLKICDSCHCETNRSSICEWCGADIEHVALEVGVDNIDGDQGEVDELQTCTEMLVTDVRRLVNMPGYTSGQIIQALKTIQCEISCQEAAINID